MRTLLFVIVIHLIRECYPRPIKELASIWNAKQFLVTRLISDHEEVSGYYTLNTESLDDEHQQLISSNRIIKFGNKRNFKNYKQIKGDYFLHLSQQNNSVIWQIVQFGSSLLSISNVREVVFNITLTPNELPIGLTKEFPKISMWKPIDNQCLVEINKSELKLEIDQFGDSLKNETNMIKKLMTSLSLSYNALKANNSCLQTKIKDLQIIEKQFANLKNKRNVTNQTISLYSSNNSESKQLYYLIYGGLGTILLLIIILIVLICYIFRNKQYHQKSNNVRNINIQHNQQKKKSLKSMLQKTNLGLNAKEFIVTNGSGIKMHNETTRTPFDEGESNTINDVMEKKLSDLLFEI